MHWVHPLFGMAAILRLSLEGEILSVPHHRAIVIELAELKKPS